MKYLFFILVYFTQMGFAQEPIYVNASENANGIGFEHFGESFIVTPALVVDSSVGDLVLSDSCKTNCYIATLETFEEYLSGSTSALGSGYYAKFLKDKGEIMVNACLEKNVTIK